MGKRSSADYVISCLPCGRPSSAGHWRLISTEYILGRSAQPLQVISPKSVQTVAHSVQHCCLHACIEFYGVVYALREALRSWLLNVVWCRAVTGFFKNLPGSRVGLELTRKDSYPCHDADSKEEPQGGLQVPLQG